MAPNEVEAEATLPRSAIARTTRRRDPRDPEWEKRRKGAGDHAAIEPIKRTTAPVRRRRTTSATPTPTAAQQQSSATTMPATAPGEMAADATNAPVAGCVGVGGGVDGGGGLVGGGDGEAAA